MEKQESNRIIFNDIDSLKQKIIELYAFEYGKVPSKDELIKFKSLDDMKKQPARMRNNFLQKVTYIYNTYSNKEIIDYTLTISQLINSNYPIARYWNSELLLILINVYNNILVDDYKKYHKIMNKRKIMVALHRRINDIVNNEGFDRRKVVTRSICSQFSKRYEQLLENNEDFSVILSTLPKEIAEFICYGHNTDLGESITDEPLIRK